MSRGNSVCFIKRGKEATDSTTQTHAVNGALRSRIAEGFPVGIRHRTKADETAYADSTSAIIATGPVLLLSGEERQLDCVIDKFSLNRHPATHAQPHT